MATKIFHISDPVELREISAFLKEGSTIALAAVWNAAINKGRKTKFDDTVFAVFSGGKKRTARIVRLLTDGQPISNVTLKYNQALKWCEEYLEQVDSM